MAKDFTCVEREQGSIDVLLDVVDEIFAVFLLKIEALVGARLAGSANGSVLALTCLSRKKKPSRPSHHS